ncbi:MAG: hypothetical protein QOC70_2733 [Verrucomicrobiota bacterium]
MDRYVIVKPSAADRIRWPIDHGGPDASSSRGDRVKAVTDREEPLFQLRLLQRGQPKPDADGRKADRIITEPRLHRLLVGRNAWMHKMILLRVTHLISAAAESVNQDKKADHRMQYATLLIPP